MRKSQKNISFERYDNSFYLSIYKIIIDLYIFPFVYWFNSTDIFQFKNPCPITCKWIDLHIWYIYDDTTTFTSWTPLQWTNSWTKKCYSCTWWTNWCTECDFRRTTWPNKKRCIHWLTIFRWCIPII